MGSAASTGVAAAAQSASPEDLKAALAGLPADAKAKLVSALGPAGAAAAPAEAMSPEDALSTKAALASQLGADALLLRHGRDGSLRDELAQPRAAPGAVEHELASNAESIAASKVGGGVPRTVCVCPMSLNMTICMRFPHAI
jgi:hypothetical protein